MRALAAGNGDRRQRRIGRADEARRPRRRLHWRRARPACRRRDSGAPAASSAALASFDGRESLERQAPWRLLQAQLWPEKWLFRALKPPWKTLSPMPLAILSASSAGASNVGGPFGIGAVAVGHAAQLQRRLVVGDRLRRLEDGVADEEVRHRRSPAASRGCVAPRGELEIAHAADGRSASLPSSIWLSTMRGCQPGRPLKSRMRAQTFSTGASMTLEMVTVGHRSVPLRIRCAVSVGRRAVPRLSMRLDGLSMSLKMRTRLRRSPAPPRGRASAARRHGRGRSGRNCPAW